MEWNLHSMPKTIIFSIVCIFARFLQDLATESPFSNYSGSALNIEACNSFVKSRNSARGAGGSECFKTPLHMTLNGIAL